MCLARDRPAAPSRGASVRSAASVVSAAPIDSGSGAQTKPFSPSTHDALGENDYVWAQFIDNRILPVSN